MYETCDIFIIVWVYSTNFLRRISTDAVIPFLGASLASLCRAELFQLASSHDWLCCVPRGELLIQAYDPCIRSWALLVLTLWLVTILPAFACVFHSPLRINNAETKTFQIELRGSWVKTLSGMSRTAPNCLDLCSPCSCSKPTSSTILKMI